MAGVYVVAGHRYDVVRLIHCLLGTCSIWLVFRIGRRTFNIAVGLIGAAIYALYPLAVLQSTELLSEPLGIFLFLMFLDLTLVFAERPSWLLAATAGLVLGAGLLTRANLVLMLPLVALWAVWRFRDRRANILRAAAIFVVALAVLAPWTLRNHRVFGEFIPFSTMGGSVLLQGNNSVVVTDPKLLGYSVWDTDIPEYRDAIRSAGNEFERDRVAKQLAIQWLKDNKDKWGFLLWHKFTRSWTPFLTNNPSAARRLLYLLSWGPVLALFVVALLPTLYLGLRYRHPVLLLHLGILHYVANSLIFFANIRYRAPVDPLCIILAAATLTWILYRVGWKQLGNSFAIPTILRPSGQPLPAFATLHNSSGLTK